MPNTKIDPTGAINDCRKFSVNVVNKILKIKTVNAVNETNVPFLPLKLTTT